MSEAGTAARPQRLPPGRHKLTREQVRESQRRRLLSAAAAELAEHGYGAITVTAVAAGAEVSTATLYKRFDGLWDCLLAAYEAGTDRLCGEIELACAAAGEDARAAAGIARGLALLAAEPALANLLLTVPPSNAVALGQARARLAERLAALLRSARHGPAAEDDRELPAIAGALALASIQLRSGGPLTDLAPTLAQVLLGPAPGGRRRSPQPATSQVRTREPVSTVPSR
ncbi:MAG TPA: TetR/AcrR family transcriptional regulator [Solirubrobacterales bacterium]|nr:TetR/AcrR family transcriptional regulator [Solirubrobacterales bacterium]